MMNYEEAWAFLDNLQFFKIKLGLDSMAGFLDSFGNPHQDLRYIHIAGTNGKGSVAITLLTLLSQAGYKVGLYTSPHLSSVRERFRINDTYISIEYFAALASRIRDMLGGRQITYFEFTTVLAMLWFVQEKVDVAILEVGLGGRLDATNVITPLVSIITNVSMDHEAYLGDTLAQVAYEKAGIIKTGVPVISGVDDEVSMEVVKKTCQEYKAPLSLLDRDFFMLPGHDHTWNYKGLKDNPSGLAGLTFTLPGTHQAKNIALALAAMEILGQHNFTIEESVIRKGLNQITWPGRLEYFCLEKEDIKSQKTTNTWQKVSCPEQPNSDNTGVRRFLLDGAHNPAGVAGLVHALQNNFSYAKCILIWASMADKDFSTTLGSIAPLCNTIIFTMPEYERSASPAQLIDALEPQFQSRALLKDSVMDAIDQAHGLASPDDLICIAGSLYLIGAARQILLGELVV